ATTAIYSAVQTTLLDPLPVKDADRLMSIESFNTLKGYSSGGVSLNTIAELQRHKEVFANVAVHNAMLAKYRGRDFIEMVRGSQVSANFFALWGVQPVLGRVFSKDEGRPEASRVVVLSHSFWRTRLGGDPQIIGKTIEFEPETESAYQRYTVIGVMPGHFVFPQQDIYFWIPKSHPDMEQRFRNLSVCFRLPIGSTALQAQAILDVISARDAVADPKFNEGWRMRLFPVSAMFADEATRQRLWTLFAVIGLAWLPPGEPPGRACPRRSSKPARRPPKRRKDVGCCHGVSPHDPVTFAILIVVLFLAATAASFIPGRRAAKVDPMEALRYE